MTYLVIYLIGFTMYFVIGQLSVFMMRHSIDKQDVLPSVIIVVVGSVLWPLMLVFFVLFVWIL